MDFTSQILRSTTMPANKTWPADQEQSEGKASTSCAVTGGKDEKRGRSSKFPKISTSAHPSSMLNLLFQASVPRQRFMKKLSWTHAGIAGMCTHWLAGKPTSRNASRNSSQVTVPLQRWPIHAHVSNCCHCRRGSFCEMSSTTHTDPDNAIIGASQTRDPDEHDKNHAPLPLNCLDSW